LPGRTLGGIGADLHPDANTRTAPRSPAIPKETTTAEVYDRDRLEAHRRTMKLRMTFRSGGGHGSGP